MMSSNRIQKRIQKKSFILLELLIAFALVSFSIVPFIRYPLHQVKKETDFLFQMELERRVNNMLCAFQEKILRKEFSAEDLFKKNKRPKLLESAKDLEIVFSEKMKRKYSYEKFIQCKQIYTNEKKEQAALIFLTVEIYEHSKKEPILKAAQECVVIRKSNPSVIDENPPDKKEDAL